VLERLVLLLIVVAIVVAAWLLLRWYLAWRVGRIALQPPPAEVLGVLLAPDSPAMPTLLYFTTDECAQCRFQQRPILERLASATMLPIVTINAIESQDLARHYGILTVPSTVLLDAQRKPVAINHGLAKLEKLHTQISALA
jgi:thiol-disulfide isomerase/thioredoxin